MEKSLIFIPVLCTCSSPDHSFLANSVIYSHPSIKISRAWHNHCGSPTAITHSQLSKILSFWKSLLTSTQIVRPHHAIQFPMIWRRFFFSVARRLEQCLKMDFTKCYCFYWSHCPLDCWWQDYVNYSWLYQVSFFSSSLLVPYLFVKDNQSSHRCLPGWAYCRMFPWL